MERMRTSDGCAPDAGVVAHAAELVALRHAAQQLQLAPKSKTQSALAGPYLSPFRGRGLDFEEVRQYQPGDDVRNIDWRVTARTGRVHSKVFHEDHERPVWIYLDSGPSMRFGTRHAFKSVAAARAAALLAWSARDAGDRVGALVSAASGATWLPAASHENHLMGVLGAISRSTAAAAPDAGDAGGYSPGATCLARMRERVERGSRVFVLSDFYDFDASWQRPLTALARRGAVTCVLVYDGLEAEAPPPGRYRVSDGRAARTFAATTAWRRTHGERFAARQQALADFCRGRRIDLVALRTDSDPASVLAGSLGRARTAPLRGEVS